MIWIFCVSWNSSNTRVTVSQCLELKRKDRVKAWKCVLDHADAELDLMSENFRPAFFQWNNWFNTSRILSQKHVDHIISRMTLSWCISPFQIKVVVITHKPGLEMERIFNQVIFLKIAFIYVFLKVTAQLILFFPSSNKQKLFHTSWHSCLFAPHSFWNRTHYLS